MTNKKKSTAPVSSVGADGEQPDIKNINEIIANENVKNNLQATNCPEKSGRGGGLQTVSMTELYDTVYPPRTPVVDGFLYGGTYLFVGAPKVGKSFFMGQLAYHVAMGLPLQNSVYEMEQLTRQLSLLMEDDRVEEGEQTLIPQLRDRLLEFRRRADENLAVLERAAKLGKFT